MTLQVYGHAFQWDDCHIGYGERVCDPTRGGRVPLLHPGASCAGRVSGRGGADHPGDRPRPPAGRQPPGPPRSTTTTPAASSPTSRSGSTGSGPGSRARSGPGRPPSRCSPSARRGQVSGDWRTHRGPAAARGVAGGERAGVPRPPAARPGWPGAGPGAGRRRDARRWTPGRLAASAGAVGVAATPRRGPRRHRDRGGDHAIGCGCGKTQVTEGHRPARRGGGAVQPPQPPAEVATGRLGPLRGTGRTTRMLPRRGAPRRAAARPCGGSSRVKSTSRPRRVSQAGTAAGAISPAGTRSAAWTDPDRPGGCGRGRSRGPAATGPGRAAACGAAVTWRSCQLAGSSSGSLRRSRSPGRGAGSRPWSRWLGGS